MLYDWTLKFFRCFVVSCFRLRSISAVSMLCDRSLKFFRCSSFVVLVLDFDIFLIIYLIFLLVFDFYDLLNYYFS